MSAIADHLPRIRAVASRHARRGTALWDDAVQEGCIGFLAAERTFDAAKGCLWSYARLQVERRVVFACRRELAAGGGVAVADVERGQAVLRLVSLDAPQLGDEGATLHGVVIDERAECPEAAAMTSTDSWRAKQALWRAVDRLRIKSASYRYQVLRRVVLGGETPSEFARRHGQHKNSVYQVRDRLLAYAREEMAA